MTTYYPDSKGITKADIGAVSDYMENTRLRKKTDGNFDLLIASAVTQVPEAGGDVGKTTEFEIDSGSLKGKKLTLVYGDRRFPPFPLTLVTSTGNEQFAQMLTLRLQTQRRWG
jgi:hypothetical protein